MQIEKRETELKLEQLDVLDKLYGDLFFAQQHQDVRKSGQPDVSLSGLHSTTWWEYKHATPRFSSPGIQENTCARLAARSFCRYIIYFETPCIFSTWIVHPLEVKDKRGIMNLIHPEWIFPGFAHDKVAEYMKRTHDDLVRTRR